MEMCSAFIFFIGVMSLCFLVYDSIPSKKAKLEESFDGFINRRLIRFENEKSPLLNIVYAGTGIGKTYFVRQYSKLYQGNCFTDQGQDRYQHSCCVTDQWDCFDNKNIIIVCKEERIG